MFTTSALSRNAANSKEVLVRVLGSTKKLTIVFPRRAGTFLISRAPTVLKAAAVSRIISISPGSNSRIPSKSFRRQFGVSGRSVAGLGSAIFTAFRAGLNPVPRRRSAGALSPAHPVRWADFFQHSPAESAIPDDRDPGALRIGSAQDAQKS